MWSASSVSVTSVRLITFHGHFYRDTQDASLRCTESLLNPKLFETLRLDTFDYVNPIFAYTNALSSRIHVNRDRISDFLTLGFRVTDALSLSALEPQPQPLRTKAFNPATAKINPEIGLSTPRLCVGQ